MSRHGLVTLAYGDGTYDFRLGLREIAEVEDKAKSSIFLVAARLGSRTATSTEIFSVLRIGLVGGGMKPVDALALVDRYGDRQPLDDSRDVAYAITLAALNRVHSAELAKDLEDVPGEPVAPSSQTGSTSAPSSPPEL